MYEYLQFFFALAKHGVAAGNLVLARVPSRTVTSAIKRFAVLAEIYNQALHKMGSCKTEMQGLA